jgi:hypothetical protein
LGFTIVLLVTSTSSALQDYEYVEFEEHADLKDLKNLQFGIYELRFDYEMLRQAQYDKIVGKFRFIITQN